MKTENSFNQLTKKLVLLICLVFGLSQIGIAQTDYTLNSGVTGNSTTWGFVGISVGLTKIKSQYVIRAEELSALGITTGLITRIGINVASQPSINLNNFNIKIGTTTQSSLDLTYQQGLTTVYNRNPQLRTELTMGWRMFVLDTPFLWDGASNVILEICWDNGSSSGSGGTVAYHIPYPSGTNSSRYNTSSSTFNCSYVGNASATSNWRPQFRLTISPLPVENAILHNEGSTEQLVFDNFLGKFENPLFRISAPANVPSFNRFQVEINTSHDFSGTSYNQTFSGAYISNLEYDLLCDNLSPSFLPTNNTTYYVRARASHDGGTIWGGWTENLHSFTYTTDCKLDWFQTKKPQFDTDVLTNLKSNFASNDFVDLNTTIPTSFIGNSTVGSNCTGWADNRMVFTEVILTYPTVITHLNLHFSSVGTGLSARFWQGIYDASGNLVVQIAQSTPVPGWNSNPTTTNPTLPPGTYYLAFMTASTANCVTYEINVGTGTTFNNMLIYNNYAPSSFPTTVSVPGSGGTTLKYNASIGGAINTGNNLSTEINYSSFLNVTSWNEAYWNASLNGSQLNVQVLYDNAGVPTLIPNGVLAGNSVGFTSSPIDLSSLNTTTYSKLYLRANFVSNGTSPQLFSWGVSVVRPESTAPTSITGTGPICFGTNPTLTANGGTLQPGHQWGWFTGSCGGTLIGTGPSITVSPTSTTTYFVGAVTADGCPAGPCISGTVTLPTVGTTLAINNDVAVCLVNSNNFVHFYEPSGRLLASINSNGQNLGNVTMTAYVDGAPALVPACDDPTNSEYMIHVMQRHWVITPSIQPTAPVTVRLPYDDNGPSGEYQTLFSAANGNANPNDDVSGYGSIRLSKYAGPDNVNNNALDNCPATGGNGGTELFSQSSAPGLQVNTYLAGFQPTARYADYAIEGFSEFWLHGETPSPLPVTLSNFTANCQSTGVVRLDWTTESEQNALVFVVQRSTDGMNWTNRGVLQAAGNSNTAQYYSFEDENRSGELTYYRLQQSDLDGSMEVFGPLAVRCDGFGAFTVFPNPTNGSIAVTIPAQYKDNKLVFGLHNPEGKLVQSVTHDNAHSNILQLDMESLARGIYFLHVQQDGVAVETIKVVKQ